MLNIDQLRAILPQAYPFVLIDRVEEFEADKKLIAIKNITGNEWPFSGEMGESKYFPETLLIEAAAQAAMVLYHVSKVKTLQNCPKYFLGRIKSNFSKLVKVGDQLKVEAFGNKILLMGGYSDIFLFSNSQKIGSIQIIYNVTWET